MRRQKPDPVQWEILLCTKIKRKRGYRTLSPVKRTGNGKRAGICRKGRNMYETPGLTSNHCELQVSQNCPRTIKGIWMSANFHGTFLDPYLPSNSSEEKEIWTLIDRGLYKNKKMIELHPAYPSTQAQRKPPRVLSHFWSQYPHSSHSFRSRTCQGLIDCSLVNELIDC